MNEANKEIINVRIDEIVPNRFQPRLTFNEEELKELSESIKMHGVIQPLVLRRLGDKFEIIAGERRYKASQMAGLSTVPAIIVEMDDRQSAEVALVENLQRKDLTAIEEAQSYKKILDMGYLTQEDLAKRMGVSQSAVANKLRLLNLSIPVKDALLNNKISERHARSLLSITDTNMQIMMLNRIMNERLTVRQTDEEINKLLGRNTQINAEPVSQSYNVNVDEIKANAQDIFASNKPNDIDMLLKPEETLEVNEPSSKTNEINVKESTNDLAINPFQEIEPEIMSFDFVSPTESVAEEKTTNSLIEEFRNNQTGESANLQFEEMPVNNTNEIDTEETSPSSDETGFQEKSLSKAIGSARDQIRKIEDMGFIVDTEEFDFNDMYQIIIKIKKD